MGELELLVIIGFGFAPDNCERILLRDISRRGVPILATARGLSDEAKEFLKGCSTVELFDNTADEFFDHVLRPRLKTLFAIPRST
jgi:hypothetical protein